MNFHDIESLHNLHSEKVCYVFLFVFFFLFFNKMTQKMTTMLTTDCFVRKTKLRSLNILCVIQSFLFHYQHDDHQPTPIENIMYSIFTIEKSYRRQQKKHTHTH